MLGEMKLNQSAAQLFIPDSVPEPESLSRITHLGIGAHQDDLEFMAFHGILNCYHSESEWFGGVTCTDGGGSPRSGPYADMSNEDMKKIRVQEQNDAAQVGHFAAMWQLAYPSAEIKDPADDSLAKELETILRICRPRVVYTHNLADKHDTHIAVVLAAIQAMRALPEEDRPEKVLGCEVWRGLDWMNDSEKVAIDVSGHENLAMALNGIFDSQIAGGKRYDIATLGRRRANATFFESHATDEADQLSFAMDLTPLVADPSIDPIAFTTDVIRRFSEDVETRIAKFSP